MSQSKHLPHAGAARFVSVVSTILVAYKLADPIDEATYYLAGTEASLVVSLPRTSFASLSERSPPRAASTRDVFYVSLAIVCEASREIVFVVVRGGCDFFGWWGMGLRGVNKLSDRVASRSTRRSDVFLHSQFCSTSTCRGGKGICIIIGRGGIDVGIFFSFALFTIGTCCPYQDGENRFCHITGQCSSPFVRVSRGSINYNCTSHCAETINGFRGTILMGHQGTIFLRGGHTLFYLNHQVLGPINSGVRFVNTLASMGRLWGAWQRVTRVNCCLDHWFIIDRYHLGYTYTPRGSTFVTEYANVVGVYCVKVPIFCYLLHHVMVPK